MSDDSFSRSKHDPRGFDRAALSHCNSPSRPRGVGRLVILAFVGAAGVLQGAVFHTLNIGRDTWFVAGLAGAGWVPHLLVGAVAMDRRWRNQLLMALALMFVGNAYVYARLFVFAPDAQGGLQLMLLPAVDLVFLLPIGICGYRLWLRLMATRSPKQPTTGPTLELQHRDQRHNFFGSEKDDQ